MGGNAALREVVRLRRAVVDCSYVVGFCHRVIDHLKPHSLPQKSHEQFIEKEHFYWCREHRIR
jgi:hypothetical protein